MINKSKHPDTNCSGILGYSIPLLLILATYFWPGCVYQKAYADGLTQVNLPTTAVGNRLVSVTVHPVNTSTAFNTTISKKSAT